MAAESRISSSPTTPQHVTSSKAVGITVLAEREVLVQRLKQEVPGQLGQISRRMADAGINIEVMYSDHANQMILLVDDLERGRAVSEAWMRESA